LSLPSRTLGGGGFGNGFAVGGCAREARAPQLRWLEDEVCPEPFDFHYAADMKITFEKSE
jgi:hypothetical protein